jgi:hypothetical protein
MATTFDPGKSGLPFTRAHRCSQDRYEGPGAAFASTSQESWTGGRQFRSLKEALAADGRVQGIGSRALFALFFFFFLLVSFLFTMLFLSFSLGREMELYGIVRMS